MAALRPCGRPESFFAQPPWLGTVCSLYRPDNDSDPLVLSEEPAASSPNENSAAMPVMATEEGLGCGTCGVTFSNVTEQRNHFKLDWHRFNVKAGLLGTAKMTEGEFEGHLAELSSISGSASDDEPMASLPSLDLSSLSIGQDQQSTQPARSPKVLFTTPDGDIFYVWRPVLQVSKNDDCDLVARLQQLPTQKKWALLLVSGGHFAGVLFDGGKVTQHKTFHRYVVRQKRGSAQSAYDSKSGSNMPKSAGASLRRYNEAQLKELIYNLFTKEWKAPLEECDMIFIAAPGANSKYIFGEEKSKAPFSRADPRLRKIPFVTRRPTYAEAVRVHTILSSAQRVQVSPPLSYNKTDDGAPALTESLLQQLVPVDNAAVCSASTSVRAQASDTTTERDIDSICSDVTPALHHAFAKSVTTMANISQYSPLQQSRRSDELFNLCRLGDLAALKLAMDLANQSQGNMDEVVSEPMGSEDEPGNSVASEGISEASEREERAKNDDRFININELRGTDGATLLHTATQSGHSAVVTWLLECGADPTLRDYRGRVPYLVARNKPVRDAFRYHMARWPDQWNYSHAYVPSPLDPEQEAARAEKEMKAKNRAAKARAKRAKEKEKKQRLREEKEKESAQNTPEQEEVSPRTSLASPKCLTEREKRALAAERRRQDTANGKERRASGDKASRRGGCQWCGSNMEGVVPFERLAYKYCCMACVTGHRDALERGEAR